jgi:hypothetical protein
MTTNPVSDGYVEVASLNPPKSNKLRRTLAFAASIAAVAVGVVLIIALTSDGSSAAPETADEGTSRCTGDSCLSDRPGGTPFVHEPNCPVLAFCRDSYVSQDATTKQADLMKKIREDNTSGPEASASDLMGIVDPAGLVDQNSNPFKYAIEWLLSGVGNLVLNAISSGLDVRTTFSIGLDWQPLKNVYTTGDQMEAGRAKAIHAVGVTGAVRFDTSSADPHPFTGLLSEGFDGIVRFSSAVPISRGSTKKKYIFFGEDIIKTPFMVAPGLGLKALVDGNESADLVSMWHLDGSPGEWNFFAHEFSTVVPGSSQTALKLVGKHFEDASMCPSHVSLLGFAEASNAGRVDTPFAPYSLVFVPNAALKKSFDDMVKDGYSPSEVHACEKSSECPDVIETLTTLKAGQHLYTIYAIAGPEVEAWRGEAGRYEVFDPTKPAEGVYKIGDLTLTSVLGKKALDRSKFGDVNLFFRHRLFEDGVLNNFCEHGKNWMPYMRFSTPLLSRNYPTCSVGGNDDDGTDTTQRKEFTCRLLFRAQAIYPECFDKVVDVWNNGGFFPFERDFDEIRADKWLKDCGLDTRPKNSNSRGMVERSYS